MTTTSQIFDSKISLFDSSFGMKDWETGLDFINMSNLWMSFDSKLNGKDISFDVTFNLEGTCKWSIDRGDYYQPDFIEQSDVDIYITLESFYSEDISLNITDKFTSDFLINLIKSNLKF
jgi:hypothetical protein